MNKQNQDRADKVAHVYKKSRKVRSADEVLKRALTDCMQEEANQVQKKMEREGQHAFSKPFIEKMQFVLKLGKQAEEQQKKKATRKSTWAAMDPCGSRMYCMCGCGRRKLDRTAWKC